MKLNKRAKSIAAKRERKRRWAESVKGMDEKVRRRKHPTKYQRRRDARLDGKPMSARMHESPPWWIYARGWPEWLSAKINSSEAAVAKEIQRAERYLFRRRRSTWVREAIK